MSAIGFILAFLFLPAAFAGVVEVAVAKGDRLLLRGFEAQVVLAGQPGAPLRISGVESSGAEGVYTVTKKGNVIEIRMNEFVGKKSWLENIPRAASHTKRIEISGEPVSAEIHLRGGSVQGQRWTRDLRIGMTQGRANLTGGAGALNVNVQRGDIAVTDHSGTVQVDSYSGNMALRNINGDVNATLFAGQFQSEKIKGAMILATQQAQAKVNEGAGSLQFENGKGALNITGFQGRVEGQNQEGAVSVSVALDGEVDVRSKSGRVSVQLPPSSGASLNLLTTDGEIIVPGELKVLRLSSEKSVRGRLRGDAQRASVFVRSQDGTISVK